MDSSTLQSYNSFSSLWFDKLQTGNNLAQAYVEKPAMYGKLREIGIAGKSVLCLGCGTGNECEYILGTGAHEVHGIDLASEMIQNANQHIDGVHFHVMDMGCLDFADSSFDVVYSSLSMYFHQDLTPVLSEVSRVLMDGGSFIFSMPHPVKWGALKEMSGDYKSYRLGFSYCYKDNEYEILGDYLTKRLITEKWFDNFEVSYYNHPIASTIQTLLKSGLTLIDCLEPKAISEAKNVDQAFYEIHQKIPLFIVYELKKVRQSK